jgi:hypothetical protein
MCREGQERSTGMWLYINGDNNHQDYSNITSFCRNPTRTDVSTQHDGRYNHDDSVSTSPGDLPQETLYPINNELTDNPVTDNHPRAPIDNELANNISLNEPVYQYESPSQMKIPDLHPCTTIYDINHPGSPPHLRFPELISPEHSITPQLTPPAEIPSQLITGTEHPKPTEVNQDNAISSDIVKIMNNILLQIELDESTTRIKEKHAKPKGLNEPEHHAPTILIDNPPVDPSRRQKRRNNKIDLPEYDPEHPEITNIRPFECPDCQKKFKNKGSLNRHCTSNHSSQTFSCEECNKTMYRKDSVRRHYLKNHPETSLPSYITMNTGDASRPYKTVKFNIKTKEKKSPPKSQFASKPKDRENTTILEQILQSLTALKESNN